MIELDYRPNRTTVITRHTSARHLPRTPAMTDSSMYIGHKRARSSDQSGWGRAVVNLVGGVAGKMFDFCWNSAFRGFQAGGGQIYKLNSGTPAVIGHGSWMDIGEKDDVFNKHYEPEHHHQSTPVPGQFPDEGFIDDYMSKSQVHRADRLVTPVPRGDEGGSIIRGNWVLIDDTDDVDERDRNPALSAHKAPRTTHNPRRPSSRPLLTAAGNRPRLVPSRPSLASPPSSNVKRPASFASPRASPGRSYASEADSHPFNLAGHRRTKSSIASPRRTATESGPRQSFTTPSSPDVQRFEKKIRRKERKEDENIQRLNKQLQDMIKEGKEALGTRIEVEDDPDEDEGYGEGTEMMGASKW